ncbi:MAG: hypothetical protein KDE14_08640, partial [Rhodobacteraceae bacterium]|nr:hypothetical protein [Paracoccaceae bacterium]
MMKKSWGRILGAILCLAVGGAVLAPDMAFAQANPFGAGRSAPNQDQQPARAEPGDEQAAPERTSPPAITLPVPVQAVFRQIADWQRALNRFMGRQMRESQGSGGLTAALVLLGASFLYGVLHAAGPGHGKMVVASYFTARQAPLATGILMGGIIAFTQAVVAIAVVIILAAVVGRTQLQVMDDASVLEIISYGIIFLIGGYMTWCALRGREAFGHDHGPAASTFDEPVEEAMAREALHGQHGHDHHHAHDHGNDHGHDHGHDHSHDHGHGHDHD